MNLVRSGSTGIRIAFLGAVLATISARANSPDSTKPTTPTNVTWASTSCSEIDLSWHDSIDPTNGNQTVSGLKGYNVYRGGSLLKFVTTTNAADTNLVGHSNFSYYVTAVDNAANESTPSLTNTATSLFCPDTLPPSVPANAAAVSTNCSLVRLTWSASTDAPSSSQQVSGLKGYNVYRGGTFTGFVTNAAFADANVSGNVTYSYRVSALDVAGNESAQSATASVSTPATVLGCRVTDLIASVYWQAGYDLGQNVMK